MHEAILVTGGAGYVGSHAAWFLAQQGYKVVVLDQLVSAHFPHHFAEYVCGDYGEKALIKGLCDRYRFVGVMHFGASTVVNESVTQPISYYHNNVAKTIVLLDTLIASNIRFFIFSSSCAVYGLPERMPLTENDPLLPISPYGTSKMMIEKILADCDAAYGLRFIALRYFNAAGAQPRERLGEKHIPETHLIPLLLSAARTGKPVSIFGTDYPTKDGTCIRDYVHVSDIATAHYQALLHLKAGHPSDIFNIGTGIGFSVKEIITSVEHTTKTKLNITPTVRRIGDPAVLVANPLKAMTLLRWKPIVSDLTTMVNSAWHFYQTHI